MHIKDLKGNKIIVTNLKETIKQTESHQNLFNDMINAKKKSKNNIIDVEYFYRDYLYKLSQLKKLDQDKNSK